MQDLLPTGSASGPDLSAKSAQPGHPGWQAAPRLLTAGLGVTWLLLTLASGCSSDSGNGRAAAAKGNGGASSGSGAQPNAAGSNGTGANPSTPGGGVTHQGNAGSSQGNAGNPPQPTAGTPASGAGTPGDAGIPGTAGTAAIGQGNTGSSSAGSPPLNTGGAATDGTPCGYQNRGKILNVAENVQLCLPPTICNLETCASAYGTCSPSWPDGTCQYKPGYNGLKTLPEAWATHYCTMPSGCMGTLETATADIWSKVQSKLNIPYCYADKTSKCLGIVAFSPLLGGNSRLAQDAAGNPIKEWGLGLTPASGLCYEITGPTGTAVVAVTDRCAGYCACDSGRTSMEECGNCMAKGAQAPDTVTPSCPCVGSVPPMGTTGNTCPTQQTCDWCMTNNHPHFDLDLDTLLRVCGEPGRNAGSCKLASVKPIPCMDPVKWPCDAGSYFCFGTSPYGQIPGTYCCK